MERKTLKLISGTNTKQADPPQARLRQIREFGRMLLADDHVMGLVMDRKISPDSDTEWIGHSIAGDIRKLRAISAFNGFASLIGIRKLGEMIENSDPIDVDLQCVQLMLIASDYELHGFDAVVESARILMNNVQAASSALFALGFGYDEIGNIEKMGKEEINQKIFSMLREKSLIRQD